jgi:hypothetical protein
VFFVRFRAKLDYHPTKEKQAFTKPDEPPSSSGDIQRDLGRTKIYQKGTLNLVLFTDTSKAVNYTG